MRRFLVNFCSAFIFNKKKRKAFREKHKQNPIKAQIKQLDEKLKALSQNITQITASMISPQSIPPAKGLDRAIQLLGLEILKDFDKVCRKHNLRYWIDFGSLLGAVRHGGFIPWDDDVDVSMPYDDYLRFQEIASSELENSIAVFPPGKWGKLIHKDFAPATEQEAIIPFSTKNTPKIYISMDIFPFHHLNSKWDRSSAAAYMKEMCKKKFSIYASEQKRTGINFETWARVYELSKADEDKLISDTPTDHMFMSLRWHFQSWGIFPPRIAYTRDIFPLKEIEFEGHLFMAPGQAEMWLWTVYGNFWKIKFFPFHVNLASADRAEIQKLMEHAKRLNCF